MCDTSPNNLIRVLLDSSRTISEISTLLSSGFFLHPSAFSIHYHIFIWWYVVLSLRLPSPIQIMVDQKQLANVEYCNYVAWRCTREIKFSTAIAKTGFNRKKNVFFSKLDLYSYFRNKLAKCYIWSIASYGAESWTLRTVDRRCLESFEIWCWRRMAKISWTDHVRNVEMLQRRVNEENNIVRAVKKKEG